MNPSIPYSFYTCRYLDTLIYVPFDILIYIILIQSFIFSSF
jgi:hypothetical protein